MTINTTGVLEQVDPNTIVIEDNVRPSAPLTKEFVQSIREHGVIVPIYGYRSPDGDVVVRAGQRRTLGAREAGVPTIPVYIVDGDENTARRIIEQLIENEQRENLTDSDRAAAWQQLTLEGMSATAIAKKTGTKVARVKQGLAVAESATAVAAISDHQLDLEQAATLIEFDDDEDATTELIKFAKERPEQFAHAAQRLRDQRERDQKAAGAKEEVAAAGFPILDREPHYWENTPADASKLTTSDGEPVTVEHLTGKEGVSAFVTVGWNDEVRISYWVDNPKAHDFKRLRADGTAATPMTDEQKAERKELIANNRIWPSAEKVRREWLTTFLARKTLPKDAARFVALGLTQYTFAVSRGLQNANSLAHELLGIDPGAGWRPEKLAATVESTPTKALHISLAVVLGAIEDKTDKGTWRHPDSEDAGYFTQLAAWGYTLSDVEQLVIDRYIARTKKADAE